VLLNQDEPFGVAIWQRPKQGRIGQCVHRAVGADAECQGQRGDEGKPGRGFELPDRELDVAAGFLEPLCQPHLAISLSADIDARVFQGPQVSGAPDGRIASRLRIHPARNQLARAQFDMKGDLLVDLLVKRHAPEP